MDIDEYQAQCDKCLCIFLYRKEDVKVIDKKWDYDNVIRCPRCGHQFSLIPLREPKPKKGKDQNEC